MTPASFQDFADTPLPLLAGQMPPASEKITLATPENRSRGALLGRITVGAVSGAAVAGNTGNGTIGSLSAGTGAKPGVYKVVIVEPATDAGNFIVEGPDGKIVGRGTVGVAFVGPVNFTLADGATNFVAGDTFDVTVAAGSGLYKLAAAAATDGSQDPVAILAEDANATAGNVEALVFTRGDFNEDALTLGAGISITATLRETLRLRGINIVASNG